MYRPPAPAPRPRRPVRMLWQCPRKACKARVATDLERSWRSVEIGFGRREWRADWFENDAPVWHPTAPHCPACSTEMRRFGEVEGRVKQSVPCDDRCVFARGRKCECSCGGKNHASNLVITTRTTVIVREAKGPES